MEPEKLPPVRTMPPIRLKFSLAYGIVDVIAIVIGILLFLRPDLAGLQSYPWLSTTLIVLIVLAVVVSLIFPWLKAVAGALYGRVNEYPHLHERASQDSRELQGLRAGALDLMESAMIPDEVTDDSASDVLSLVTNRFVISTRNLEILKANVFELGLAALAERVFKVQRVSIDEKDRLIVAVENTDALLRRGDKLVVVDTEDMRERASFEVSAQSAEECYAVESQLFEEGRIWKGFINEKGAMDILPDKIAILMERSTDDDRR